MTQQVTVYRWDDEGAPQITKSQGTANEIKTVLDKCLVDGYASKPALGWTKVFDDTNGVVYQNGVGGSGGMVRFWPKSANWSLSLDASSPLFFQSAKAYIASQTAHHEGNFYGLHHPAYGAFEKAWVLIGTSTAFYLIMGWVDPNKTDSSTRYLMSSATQYNCSIFVGDIISEIDNDAGRFTAFASAASSNFTSITWYCTLDYLNSNLDSFEDKGQKFYSADNAAAYRLYMPRLTFPKSTLNISPHADLLGYVPVPLVAGNIAQIPEIEDPNLPALRGYMPGMINTLRGLSRIFHWPQTKLIDGQQYWQLRYAQSDASHIWINMEQW
ncbi:hypothetical protein [Pseudoalteromonas xiamenensis]